MLTSNRQDDAQVGRSSSAVEKTVTAVARLKEGWIPSQRRMQAFKVEHEQGWQPPECPEEGGNFWQAISEVTQVSAGNSRCGSI